MSSESSPLSGSSAPRVTRPALRYHGGKFRLAPKLISIFPAHRVYTEAFGGGASVLLLKPRCYSEIYNDLDGEVVNVFRVLQNRSKAKRLRELLQLTPFAREEFLVGYQNARSDVERGATDDHSLVHGLRLRFDFADERLSRGIQHAHQQYDVHRLSLEFVSQRNDGCNRLVAVSGLRRIVLRAASRRDDRAAGRSGGAGKDGPPGRVALRRSALSDVHSENRKWLSPEASLSLGNDGRGIMNRLAALLRRLQGAVIVSSYPGALYERLYADWYRLEWTGGQLCSQNTGERKRTECVWLNDKARQLSPIRRLF